MFFQSMFLPLLNRKIITSTEANIEGTTITFQSDQDFENNDLISLMNQNHVNKIVISQGVTQYPTFIGMQIVPTISFQSSDISAIPNFAFFRNKVITTVELSDSITEIGEAAFYSSSITNIQFTHIQIIDNYAFYGCQNLIEVEFPDGCQLGSSGFAYSGVQNVKKFPLNAKAHQFYCCRNLVSVSINHIMDAGRGIVKYAFYCCSSLTNVQFINQDTRNNVVIGKYAFSHTAISQFNFEPIRTINDYCFEFCKFTTLSINNENMRIRAGAFSGNYDLTTVLQLNVQEIEYNCFENCPKLQTFTSDTLTSLPDDSFTNCSSLVTVNVPNCREFGTGCFYHCISLKNVTCMKNDIHVSEYAFFYCQSLQYFPLDGITKGGDLAFRGCINLESPLFTVSRSLEIKPYMFSMCSKITSMNIESATLDDLCFSFCDGLTTVNLGAEVTSISLGCFYGCTKLSSINLENVNEIDSYAFRNTSMLKSVKLGIDTMNVGVFEFSGLESVTLLKTLSYNIEEKWFDSPDFEEYFPSFRGTKLRTVNVGANVHSFAPHMFIQQKEIQIVIDGSNTLIKKENNVLISPTNELFYYLPTKQDKSFTIPDSVTSIGQFAFVHAKNLETLTINKNINTVNFMCAFCGSLKSVIYEFDAGQNEYNLGMGAFYRCYNLMSVRLPENLPFVVESHCFQYCTRLETFNFSKCMCAKVYSFSHCENLKSIQTHPNLKTEYFGHTFEYTGITKIEIYSQQSLQYNFYHCKNLKNVTVMERTYLHDSLFEHSPVQFLNGTANIFGLENNCFAFTKLRYFKIPDDIKSINGAAFRGNQDFRYIVCNHPKYIVTDHELIEVPSYTLISTFGTLNSTYVVPSCINSIANDAIVSTPVIDMKTQKVIDFGVTTVIIHGDTKLNSNPFRQCPYLYNLCYGGHFQPNGMFFDKVKRVFVPDYFDGIDYWNIWGQKENSINVEVVDFVKVIKGKCETSVPYQEYAKGNLLAKPPSGNPKELTSRSIQSLIECNEDLIEILKLDEPLPDPDPELEDPQINTTETNVTETHHEEPNVLTPAESSPKIQFEDPTSKKSSPLLVVLIVIACIELVAIISLLILFVLKNREDDSESSVVVMHEEAITYLTTETSITTENSLFTMNAIDDDPFAQDFDSDMLDNNENDE